ncbi:phenylacetic acid degradation protein PaaY [Aureimonas ureilytica]|uniref:Phenylacetic acid degradation protein PaaY n=1 Tax=Aureimonas ureilytica TaxID=401562 RepID=A0A175R961_9HYPH|nr:transferase hexapeptide repeat family protein [Aureimonas ureilytica]KTQ96306.1 phenylacetic acid degradation protein PaaY [Aureimonas ureilytica]
MSVWSFDGIVPVVDPSAFVHPDATLIGDVLVGAGVYVGPQCVLRGDFGRIVVGVGANVQETCVVHSFPNGEVEIEEDGHIGHGAVLHGCRIGRNAMVGMNAVVMDGAEIGKDTIVAALAFVKAGAIIPPRSLVVGSPARVTRELTDEEIDWKGRGTAIYQRLALEAPQRMAPAHPLATPEPDRRRVRASDYDPLMAERMRAISGRS